jgi:hypothetical protein
MHLQYIVQCAVGTERIRCKVEHGRDRTYDHGGSTRASTATRGSWPDGCFRQDVGLVCGVVVGTVRWLDSG